MGWNSIPSVASKIQIQSRKPVSEISAAAQKMLPYDSLSLKLFVVSKSALVKVLQRNRTSRMWGVCVQNLYRLLLTASLDPQRNWSNQSK